MARSPAKIVRNGNEKIVSNNTSFVGPGCPAVEGSIDKPSGYQSGLPVNDGIVRKINATGNYVPGKINEVGPDWGPTPEASEAV